MSTKQDVFHVEISLADEGAAEIGDMLRSVAAEIEREPHWETVSAPINDARGEPIGHWRIVEDTVRR